MKSFNVVIISILVMSLFVIHDSFANKFGNDIDIKDLGFEYSDPVDNGTITSKTKSSSINNVLALAKRLIGNKKRRFNFRNRVFNGDCSGFISYIFYKHGKKLLDKGIKLKGNWGAYSIYYSMKYQSSIHRRKIPKIGDLVFFHHSYDRNKDGRVNDYYSHIGIVEKIRDDGTIIFIHYLNPRRGVRRDKVNLLEPNNYKKNSFLRDRRRYPNPKGEYLTGQLFAGFSTVRMN